jgi:hypothetical protein
MYGQFYTAAMQMQQWQAAESHHLFPATVVRDTPDLANCQRWVPPRRSVACRCSAGVCSVKGREKVHTARALRIYGAELAHCPAVGVWTAT